MSAQTFNFDRLARSPYQTVQQLRPRVLARVVICAGALAHLSDQVELHSALHHHLFALWHSFATLVLTVRQPRLKQTAIDDIILKNCDKFLMGDWASLYRNATSPPKDQRRPVSSAPNALDAAALPDDGPVSAAQISRATALARIGSLSKANTILTGDPPPSDDGPSTEAQLREKHPSQPAPTISARVDPDPEPIDITVTDLRFVVHQAAPGGAPDQWGWRIREHLDPLLAADDEVARQLHRLVFAPLAAGLLPVHLRPTMGGGKLLALAKPGKPGVRPIAIGDAFRRIVGRAVLRAIKPALCDWFTTGASPDQRVCQFAVGLPDGGPKIAKYVGSLLDQPAAPDDPQVVLSMDIRNAFNELDRQAMLDSLTGTASRIYDHGAVQIGDPVAGPPGLRRAHDFIVQYYGGHTSLHFRHRDGHTADVDSTGGTQQGDVLAQALFAAPLHAVLLRVSARHPNVRFSAYADNVYINAPLSYALQAACDYALCARDDLGLHCNPHDSKLYCPAWSALDAPPDGLQAALASVPDYLQGLSWTPHGLMVAGVPVGSLQYQLDTATAIVTKITATLPRLAACTDGYIHYLLLKYCANTRFHYIMRCLPPAITDSPAADLDRHILHAIASYHQWPDDYLSQVDYQRAAFQIRLPPHAGGWGLTPAASITTSAFYASTAEYLRWLSDSQLLRHLPFTADTIATFDSPLLSSYRTAHNFLVNSGAHVAPPLPLVPPPDDDDSDGFLVLPSLPALVTQADPPVPVPKQRAVTRFLAVRSASHAADRARLFPPNSHHAARLLHLQSSSHLLRPDPTDRHGSCSRFLTNSDANRKRVRYSPLSFLTVLPIMSDLPFNCGEFRSWAESMLGLPVSTFAPAIRARTTCKCGATFDPHGHHQQTCNQFSGRRWHRAHELLVHAFHHLARQAAVPCENRACRLPIASDSNRQGDLHFSVALGGRTSFGCDVTMRHPYKGASAQDTAHPVPIGQWKPNTISEAVRQKLEHHTAWHHDNNMHFLPLVFDTHGAVDGNVPRLLWWLGCRQAERARANGRLESLKFLRSLFYTRACAHISGVAARSSATRLLGSYLWEGLPQRRDHSALPALSDDIPLRPAALTH